MNCAEALQLIARSIPGNGPMEAALRSHLASCDDCREAADDAVLAAALRQLTVPPPRAGFVDAAINRAIVSRRRPQWQALRALAASLAVIGIALGVLYGAPPQPISAVDLTLAANQDATIRVLIDSRSQQDVATVTIELSDNLELAGFARQKKVEWQTSLLAGKNLLALPVVLIDDVDGHLDVAVAYGSTRKVVRVAVHRAPAHDDSPPLSV